MMASNSPGLIVRIPKLSDPRKSLTLNVTIGDPLQTATSRIRSSSGQATSAASGKIDLDQSGTAAKVLGEIVDIAETHAPIPRSTLEHRLVFERQTFVSTTTSITFECFHESAALEASVARNRPFTKGPGVFGI
jgi:hypothetical protein